MSTTETVTATSVDKEETHVERNLKFFETGKYSDVTFIVGADKTVIRAHKVYLRAQSPVFDEIFNKEPEKSEFEVPEVKPEYFRLLLKFVYTGDWEIEAIDTAIPLYYSAQYYKLAETSIIEQKILGNDLKEAAIVTYMESFKYGLSEIMEAAAMEVCKYAYELVEDPKFLQLSSECLEVLIVRDDLAVFSEIQLFQVLMKWATARKVCEKAGTVVTPKYCRSVLDKLIPLIRFPLMDLSDFGIHVYYSDILTTEEALEVSIYHNIKVSQRHLVPGSRLFNCTPRKYTAKVGAASEPQNLKLVGSGKIMSDRPLVFMKIAADGEMLGTIIFELRRDLVPLTAEFFRASCVGENGFGYKGTQIQTHWYYDQSIMGPLQTVIIDDCPIAEKSTLENGFGALSVYFCEDGDGTTFWINGSLTGKNACQVNGTACGNVLFGMDVVRKIIENAAFALSWQSIVIVECGQI